MKNRNIHNLSKNENISEVIEKAIRLHSENLNLLGEKHIQEIKYFFEQGFLCGLNFTIRESKEK